MIIEFSVGNFLSFNKPVTLSMIAAPINEHADSNIFKLNNKFEILKSAVIYGANASGKSNLIKAFNFLKNIVLTSSKESQASEKININSFQLNKDASKQPTYFEIVFIESETQFRYGFELTPSEIINEWLYFVPSRKEAKLFERSGNKISLGEYFKEGKGLESKTRSNALFLSVVAQFNGEISQRLLSWFQNMSVFSGLEDRGFMTFTLQKLRDQIYKEKILSFLKIADLDIQDIKIESSPIDSKEQLESNVNQLITSWQLRPGGGKIELVRISTQHKQYDSDHNETGVVNFDFDLFESEGTKKILALSAPLIHTLETGKILVIDEFDARLHPLLTRKIIKLFNSKNTNPNGAQLIFATHDTNLLDKDFLRRDQIWFMEKDRYSASQLYSLVEYKLDKKMVRKDSSYERQYIIGKYGAIPFLGNFEDLLPL